MSENFCPAANAELSFTENERIPAEALSFYEEGKEWNRLRTGLGLIEFERTKELLLEFLPKPPAVLYDVGGGYGEYSWWLSSLGYEVYLFDLSETNILLSEKLAPLYPGTTLKRAVRADARRRNRLQRDGNQRWFPSLFCIFRGALRFAEPGIFVYLAFVERVRFQFLFGFAH